MKVTEAERHVGDWAQVGIYLLGFWAPWERYTGATFGGSTVWTAVPALLFRQHWLEFSASARALLVAGVVLAVVAACFRVAGSVGRAPSGGGPGGAGAPAEGIYRHMRHPMVLGTVCHGAALALLMPPSGAMVALLMTVLLQGWLALRRDRRLHVAGLGGAAYQGRVPALVGSFRPRVEASGRSVNWARGILAQSCYVATALGFLVQGSSYNGTLILRWVLIGFGLQIIVDALWPRQVEA